jgi:predicted DNA-binding transcriptional regulator AlpA
VTNFENRNAWETVMKQDCSICTKQPKTKRDFARWLQAVFDDLKDARDADFYEQMEIAQMVEEASVWASRFGAGHLIDQERPMVSPRDALTVIGRLLAWAEKEENSATLDVYELAKLLGCHHRTIWRHEGKGLIPEARRIGGIVRWDRTEIEEWLAGPGSRN